MSARPSITAGELARRLGGTLRGDAARVLRGVAPLVDAGPDDVSWIAHPKYLARLAHSRAGLVIAPPSGIEIPPGRDVVHVPDPDASLTLVLALLAPPAIRVPPGIHPTAVVAPDAVVAGAALGPHVVVGAGAVVEEGAELHAGVYVGPGCRIGRGCVLWPNVVVREDTVIGERVVIHPNATIGADGFGYLYREGAHLKIPQIGRVVIEDDVEIGAGTCIDRARSGETRIGRGTKIDNLVQIGHNVQVGAHCILVSQAGVSGSCRLGHHVVLGGQVGVADHVELGDGAQVAAQGGVAQDIPPGVVHGGSPSVEVSAWRRQMVSLRRLPDVLERLRALEQRIRQLESTTHDRA